MMGVPDPVHETQCRCSKDAFLRVIFQNNGSPGHSLCFSQKQLRFGSMVQDIGEHDDVEGLVIKRQMTSVKYIYGNVRLRSNQNIDTDNRKSRALVLDEMIDQTVAAPYIKHGSFIRKHLHDCFRKNLDAARKDKLAMQETDGAHFESPPSRRNKITWFRVGSKGGLPRVPGIGLSPVLRSMPTALSGHGLASGLLGIKPVPRHQRSADILPDVRRTSATTGDTAMPKTGWYSAIRSRQPELRESFPASPATAGKRYR